MSPARQIFESFAASSPTAPPPDPIDAAQVRLAAWEAGQLKFVAAIYLVGTVAQRAGLSTEYAASRVAELLPRAMDASEGDQHIDIHRGGVPS